MDIDSINKSLLTKTLNFHGIQLQKIFETEYSNFSNLKLDSNLHFNEYTKRQKQLRFQDRGKRFRLQQFICKHANKLFARHMKPLREDACRSRILDTGYYPVLPPFEWFLSIDKELRLQRFFEYIKEGDIIAATVVSKTAAGIILKILFGECDEIRCVPDVGIKAFCPTSSLIPAVEKNTSTTRAFLLNDLVCCEILEVSTDTEKIVCGMKGIRCKPENRDRLGLMHSDDFPLIFRKFQEKRKDVSYNTLLEKSDSFHNPNLVNNLLAHLGIANELYTHVDYLKEKFPEREYAGELRQAQAAKWSFHSVTEGIEHFKCGRFSEAFQCLNKALTIDARNIEALVARGALYANSSNYEKAIIDFENALKFNPNHQNAKKYLGDTLIAYGRTFEENGKYSDAVKSYENCLALIPNHEEARNSLQFIKNKLQAASKKDNEETFVDVKKIRDINNTLNQLLTQNEGKHQILREMKKLKMKRHASSSSSSSLSSDSSTDSSDDTSSSSGSSTKLKKKKRSKKENSLSPLSKRMALMENAAIKDGYQTITSSTSIYNPSSIPYTEDNENEYELRVRKFLEETKKDDDYEDKVRKFLDETAKWKKKQKIKDEKIKKKKKDKKLKAKKKKKESKRKKKQIKEEKKHKNRAGGPDEEEELILPEKYLGLSSLKDLEDLQSKLSAYYSKVEKTTVKGKKEKHSNEKKNYGIKHKIPEIETKLENIERNQRSIEKKKSEMYEDGQSTEEKNEMNSIKFKMQVPTVNKVQKRTSEDPFWGDEKAVSDVEIDDLSKSKSHSDHKEHHNERNTNVESTARPGDTPPLMDKLGGFHIKKMMSTSPKQDIYSPDRSMKKSRSVSRSKTPENHKKTLRNRSRSTSRKRYRYSKSHSRSSSLQRGKYSRYSRSRSYSGSRSRSRSRTRSPYYRRNYHPRGRGGGTYYKPRIQNYRGYGYRGNWRNNYGGRNRGYTPRYRGNRRPYYRDYRKRDDREYRRYDRRTPSNEDYAVWRDNSKERIERSERRHSESDVENRDTSYDEYVEDHDDAMIKSVEQEDEK